MIIVCPSCTSANRVPDERLSDSPSCGRCKADLFSGKPVEVDGNALAAHVSRGDLPVLVDFWAPWCGPCRMMAPEFEKAAAALEPKVRLLKLDTQAHQEAGASYAIRSIPTMILFKGGREVARQSGAMSSAQIQAWVRQNI
jgi:thioredoxin 2